jgi:hypothetical protein
MDVPNEFSERLKWREAQGIRISGQVTGSVSLGIYALWVLSCRDKKVPRRAGAKARFQNKSFIIPN